MFFSKSYSDNSVQKSARWIRFFNDNLYSLLSLHEARLHKQITKFYDLQNLGPFDKDKIEASKIIKLFGNGGIMSILNYFFEGEHKDFDKFAKEAINLSFNLGVGMNNGKSMFKSFIKDRSKISDFKNSGEDWVNEFLIPEVIKKNLTIEQVQERFEEDELEEDVGVEVEIKKEIKNINNVIDFTEEIEEENNKEKLSLYDQFKSSLKVDEKKRYDIYSDFCTKEFSNEAIFNKENLSESKLYSFELNFEKLERENIELAKEYYKYKSSQQNSLEMFILMQDILKSQKIKTSINFDIPTDELEEVNHFVKPVYFSVPFYKLADQMKDKGYFKFEFMDIDFPKYCRLFISNNTGLKIISKILIHNQEILFNEANVNLSHYFSNDKILKLNSPEIELIKKQDFISVNYQIENFEKKEDLHWKLVSVPLRDKLKLPKLYDEAIYYENAKKCFENSNDKIDHAAILKELSYLELDYKLYDFGIFRIGDFHFERSEYYDETGSLFDEFDNYVMDKLIENGINLDKSSLSKNKGVIPFSVMFALSMERKLAPYFYDEKFLSKFEDLMKPISERNSLNLIN